ncbi:MAG: DUF3570 domain-containing protein [Candidatus Krumholzibacteriia bacterium]
MKARDPKFIRSALAAACTAIGVNAQAIPPIEIDTAALFYTESDRVTALESRVNARTAIGEGKFFNLQLVYDALSGASPSGATRTDAVQTLTRPSGIGSYTIQPGEDPLDDTFKDSRVEADASVELPLGRLSRVSVGVTGSNEFDYRSIGATATVTRDFSKRNRTLSVGVSASDDEIDPEGGPPIPFASMQPAGTAQPRETGTKSRTTVDVLLGLTQIVSPSTLAQINYSLTESDGYHTDPFKLLSVVDGAAGPNPGATVDYVYERRPDSRTKQSLYGKAKHHLTRDIVDLSYRYLWDDWGVRSHTVETHYAWQLGPGNYLIPHVRYYHQSAADFYRHSLVQGAATPAFASADPRLGEFDAWTTGVKYTRTLANGHKIGFRGEYYLQIGDSSPPDAIGLQRGQDLYPSLNALITQVSYSFTW